MTRESDSEEIRHHAATVRSRFPTKRPIDGDPDQELAYIQSQLALHDRILRGMSDAIVVTDHEAEITYVNSAAERLFRRQGRTMEGMEIFDLLKHPETAQPLSDIRQHIAAGHRTEERRVAIEHPDGHHVYAMMTVEPLVVEGVLVRAVGFFRDLTNIERANEELRRANDRERANRPHDVETAFYRRKAFLERMGWMRAIACKHALTIGLFVIHVGAFRNGEYPLAAIRAIADALRSIRQDDMVIGRVQPHVFALLYPCMRVEDQASIIQQLTHVATVPWDGGNGPLLPLRISCNAACYKGLAIPDAERFLESVENAARSLHNDSGTFEATKPPT